MFHGKSKGTQQATYRLPTTQTLISPKRITRKDELKRSEKLLGGAAAGAEIISNSLVRIMPNTGCGGETLKKAPGTLTQPN